MGEKELVGYGPRQREKWRRMCLFIEQAELSVGNFFLLLSSLLLLFILLFRCSIGFLLPPKKNEKKNNSENFWLMWTVKCEKQLDSRPINATICAIDTDSTQYLYSIR